MVGLTPLFDEGIAYGYPIIAKGDIRQVVGTQYTPSVTWEYFSGIVETKLAGGFLPVKPNRSAFDYQMKKLKLQYNGIPDTDVLDRSFNYVHNEIQRAIPSFRMLSYKEAKLGLCDDLGKLEPLNLDASPGYTFKSEYGKKKKDGYEACPEKVVANDIWDFSAIKAGIPVCYPIAVALKDEKRDAIRVSEGKVRIFDPCPDSQVTTGRMLWGDFLRQFYHQHGVIFSEVGTSFFYGGFEDMWMRITDCLRWIGSDEADILCSDLKAQDKSYQPMYFDRFGNLLDDLSESEEHGYMIKVHLERTKVSILLLLDGTVIILRMHNPSGWEGTIAFNTYGTGVSVVYAILKTAQKLGGDEFMLQMTQPEIQRSVVRFSCVGDDNVLSSAINFRIKIEDYIEFLQHCGWDTEASYFTLENCTYLGHKPLVVHEYGVGSNSSVRILPVLGKSRIVSICEFGKKKDTIVEIFSRALNARMMAFPYILADDYELFALMDLYCDMLYMMFKDHPNIRSIPLRKTLREIFELYTATQSIYNFRRQFRQIWIEKRCLLGEMSQDRATPVLMVLKKRLEAL